MINTIKSTFAKSNVQAFLRNVTVGTSLLIALRFIIIYYNPVIHSIFVTLTVTSFIVTILVAITNPFKILVSSFIPKSILNRTPNAKRVK